MKKLQTDKTVQGRRLDQWLAQQPTLELSRNRIQTMIRNNMVTVNGTIISKPHFKLSPQQWILIAFPQQTSSANPQGEKIAFTILYEDSDIIVLNKPAGLVVHPGNGNLTGTLVNALIYHCGDNLSGIGGIKRPGIVHRLDKDTSGVMVVAKNDHSHNYLSKQFADHGRTGLLERSYIAIVWGSLAKAEGTISFSLARSHHNRTRQTVVCPNDPGARYAITHYQFLEKLPDKEDSFSFASLIKCHPQTGRTHQIRVHMTHIGHPLVGDGIYGNSFKTRLNLLPEPERSIVYSFKRQALHAENLTFKHPVNGKILTFSADIPDDMQKLISTFRNL